MIAHDTIYLTSVNINDPEVSLNHDKLEALCHDCHNREHHGSNVEVMAEGLMFNKDGQLVRKGQGTPL